jgi:hypothetical protein
VRVSVFTTTEDFSDDVETIFLVLHDTIVRHLLSSFLAFSIPEIRVSNLDSIPNQNFFALFANYFLPQI